MSINYYNNNLNTIHDDWGWFIDIDDYGLNEKISRKNLTRNIGRNLCTNLDKIFEEDDEFDYYLKNSKESNIYDCFKFESNLKENEIEENIVNSLDNKIVKISSTTVITALLTYIIWFII